jgi:hypothetical protein
VYPFPLPRFPESLFAPFRVRVDLLGTEKGNVALSGKQRPDEVSPFEARDAFIASLAKLSTRRVVKYLAERTRERRDPRDFRYRIARTRRLNRISALG